MITAWNPRSVRLCAADNERRGARLRSDLEARGLPCHPAGNGEGEWAEPGFLVLDLSLRTAAELGERWEQNAVIWGVGRRAALVWCADGRQMTRRWLCEKGM
nr:DUF3293 domain-containing protein [Deinobacterium chartae]